MLCVLAAVSALSPAAAHANNDNLACQTRPADKVIKKVFGLGHVVVEKKSGGGVGEENGAFTSHCLIVAYNKPPQIGVHPFGPPPKLRVRKGFAQMLVYTIVQDDGPGGDAWDPDTLRTDQLAAMDATLEDSDGHTFPVPDFSASDAHAITYATEADNADAFWQEGEDGFVGIKVQCHGSARQHLLSLAGFAVASFNP